MICFLFALASDSSSKAQDLFWDANGASAGFGGTGTWATANVWRAGSGTGLLGDWANGRNAYFGGTAGSVTIDGTAVAPLTSYVTVTGYTLQTDAVTTTRSHNGSIVLSGNVILNLLSAGTTAARNLNIGGGISGEAGSSLAIRGDQTFNNAARVNLSVAGATVTVPTAIVSSGSGLAGFVATASGTMIAGDIVNNGSARTMLGATSGNTLTFASGAAHGGTGSLQISAGQAGGGAGVVLVGGLFAHTGDTILDHAERGVLRMVADNRLSANSELVFNNGTLDLLGSTQTVAGLSGSGGRGIVNTSANQATLVVDLVGGSQTYGAGIGVPTDTTNISGANNRIALVKSGSGTLILSGSNTHTGTTHVSGGTLALGNLNALQNSTLNTGASGVQQVTFTVAGNNTYRLGGLEGADNLSVGANSLNIGSNGASTLYSGIVSGTGNLTKTGGGSLTFSGSNSYTGATSVSAGNLLVNGDQSLATGTVTVASGATLGGGGKIGGNTIFNGAIHAPGNSPGVITHLGDVTYNTGSLVQWELTQNQSSTAVQPGSSFYFDQIVVEGSLDFAGTTTMNLTFNSASAVNWNDSFWDMWSVRDWLVYEVEGGITNFGNLSLSDPSTWIDSTGESFTSARGDDLPSSANFYLYQSGSSIFLRYEAVPEPAGFSVLALALGMITMIARTRRRMPA